MHRPTLERMGTPPPSEGLSLAAVAPIVETRILVNTIENFRPGEPVLDPDSGEYHPGPDQILYTGAGAIFSAGGPGLVLSLEGQAYADDTRNRYRPLAPLDVPLASREDRVRVAVTNAGPGSDQQGVAGHGHLRRQLARRRPYDVAGRDHADHRGVSRCRWIFRRPGLTWRRS